ncbi:MAG: hypothetical protein KGJ23_14780 [Euryarchaeota archaeon]|nr:hypothetical protein [Euryarchaeota archaeon]MDE1837864.1 hypothetical protein [Euryarchaeota archaeon]MDE1880148.1 hypothetical protein [Euryarchaeota archaeon]MDE2046537.1 hypothetical protein [Thermoplasmata archaeon]
MSNLRDERIPKAPRDDQTRSSAQGGPSRAKVAVPHHRNPWVGLGTVAGLGLAVMVGLTFLAGPVAASSFTQLKAPYYGVTGTYTGNWRGNAKWYASWYSNPNNGQLTDQVNVKAWANCCGNNHAWAQSDSDLSTGVFTTSSSDWYTITADVTISTSSFVQGGYCIGSCNYVGVAFANYLLVNLYDVSTGSWVSSCSTQTQEGFYAGHVTVQCQATLNGGQTYFAQIGYQADDAAWIGYPTTGDMYCFITSTAQLNYVTVAGA